MHKFILILFTVSLLLSLNRADAQRRTTYESLLRQSEQPSTYIDHVVFPTADSSSVAAVFFRLDYDFLPFLRVRPDMQKPSEETEFFSPVRMGIEFFEGETSESRRNSRNTGISVFRDFWSDTVWVDSFQETTSRFDHVQGLLHHELKNGKYHFELQLGRGQSNRDLPSQRRNLTVPVQSSSEEGSLILAASVTDSNNRVSGTLLNYGNNVLYGQNFDLLIQLPGSLREEYGNLTLRMRKLMPGESENAMSDAVLEQEIANDDIFYAVFDSAGSRDDQSVGFSLRKTGEGEGFPFAILSIPNADFENAGYRVEVVAEGREKPLAMRNITSRWIDMPVSLYNLDVAIDNLKFIVDDNRLRSINSGSNSERERKFREFWEERDPTPDTEFNELMTEYYRRIDYSYRNFSSLQTPGFETDQGRAYILYGPPDNIERRLPTNSPTREIWTYPNRTLIFEATTGFGDFRLISES